MLGETGRAPGGFGDRGAGGGGRQLGRRARRRALVGAADTVLCRAGESEAALRPLPIAALRLPGDIVDGLRVLGFDRIGELAAQPRAPLALRFGPEVGRRLDQAMGRLAEPITPLRPAELVEVRRAFAEPIAAAETIARYIGKLVVDLCAKLEQRGLGARRLDLIFTLVDAGTAVIRVGTALPSHDPRRLTRLLCDRIETVDPGFGIELMSLTATLAEPMVRKQTASDLVEEPEPGCLRPGRHPVQPHRRAAALPLRPGRERCARTLGSARRPALAG